MSTCLTTIAYNEHEHIVPCIESARQAGCDRFLVLDTGSEDDTAQLARSAGAVVHYHDFRGNPSGSDRRNMCLDLARQQGAEYIFWLDADDRIEGQLPKRPEHHAYNIFVHMDEYRFHRVHILRSDLQCQWDGLPRHEDLDILEAPLWEGCHVVEGPHRPHKRGGTEADARVLIEYFEKHPDSTRAVFYIARSLLDSGGIQEAIPWFRRRIAMGGPIDEIWFSWYTIAKFCEPLSADFWEALNACVSILPDRMEPYCLLAFLHNNAGHSALAMLAARIGLSFADSKQLGTLIDQHARWRLENEFNRARARDEQTKEN